jgi:DNA-binding TFAR19-related protein (PDSD5 family)
MIDYQYLPNSKHWRDRAEQTLAKARQESRPEARDRLQKIALEYKQLAERAERYVASSAEQSGAEIAI